MKALLILLIKVCKQVSNVTRYRIKLKVPTYNWTGCFAVGPKLPIQLHDRIIRYQTSRRVVSSLDLFFVQEPDLEKMNGWKFKFRIWDFCGVQTSVYKEFPCPVPNLFFLSFLFLTIPG
jgi:hypothetical protein